MVKKVKDSLMLDKATIAKAVEEMHEVKKKYPAFWKFHEMLLELNNGLAHLEKAFEKKKK